MEGGVEILVEEGVPQAVSGVGQQGVDRPTADQGAEPIHALIGRQVDLQRLDLGAQGAKVAGGLVDLGPVSGDDQVVATLGAQPGQLIADAGRGAGDDGELAGQGGGGPRRGASSTPGSSGCLSWSGGLLLPVGFEYDLGHLVLLLIEHRVALGGVL